METNCKISNSQLTSIQVPLAPKSGIVYTNCFVESNQNTFQFTSPQEAPVFRPTKEEFAKGPLNYIAQIRSQAEPYGICKIIPPPDFQPPFTVNVEQFRFTPRVQRLNELEAQTRVKLNFLEQVIKYWDLQGQQIKIPSIDKKLLDLYVLYKAVESEGGFEACIRDKKWSLIATKLGIQYTTQSKGTIASLIRHHYEKILYPFDLFVQGVLFHAHNEQEERDENCNDSNETNSKSTPLMETDKEITNEDKPEQRQLRLSPRRLSRRLQGNANSSNSNKEVQRFHSFATAPKVSNHELESTKHTLSAESPKSNKNVESSVPQCKRCSSAVDQIDLVKCAFCQHYIHIYCLIPPLNDVPKGTWHCPKCITLLFQTQPQAYTQEFGFAQSQRSYSLAEFGEVADQFKTDYFRMPCHTVPLNVVEKEFWRLVSSIEDMVSVEYGADLHTFDFGSGFPTRDSNDNRPEDLPYVDHPWNLNNLPVLEGSVFKYINTDINGMIIPWMYVGMCFSTFCWHFEDHWSYSINYLHWGEVKTWYGVPGTAADKFEAAMKQSAPELFASQPDLLHQLVTICNPNLLQTRDVPIYRINQNAGEFVVTFPRAYHAGFNQGLNFAEAVNFSPADWISLGRECMAHYKKLHRFPVFSHDELVCKMANDPDRLDICLTQATYLDLKQMIEDEKQTREQIFRLGVTNATRETFELMPDDERQCTYCKTTCFLSAVSCPCNKVDLVCLHHIEKLCQTCDYSSMFLRYRYTLDELPIMLIKLKQRSEEYENWKAKVDQLIRLGENAVMDCNSMIDFIELKNLISEAKKKNFPVISTEMEKLKELFELSKNMSKVCADILEQQRRLDIVAEQSRRNKIMRISKNWKKSDREVDQGSTETEFSSRLSTKKDKVEKQYGSINNKLRVDEFVEFVEEVKAMPCKIAEFNDIGELYDRVLDIKVSIDNALKSNEMNSFLLDELISRGESIANVDFGKKLTQLVYKHEEVRWLEECSSILTPLDDNRKKRHQMEISFVKNLILQGQSLTSYTATVHKRLSKLNEVILLFDQWKSKAGELLGKSNIESNDEFKLDAHKALPKMEQYEKVLQEADEDSLLIKFNLNPQFDQIIQIVDDAKETKTEIEELFQKNLFNSEPLFVEMAEQAFNKAKRCKCFLPLIEELSSICVKVSNWREKMNRAFIKKVSIYKLEAVLLPRTKNSLPASIDLVSSTSKTLFQQLKKSYNLSSVRETSKKLNWFEKQLQNDYSLEKVQQVYREAERAEEVCMKEIRDKNLLRNHHCEDSSEESPARPDTDMETEEDACDRELDASKERYCICGKIPNEWMIQCQLCQDWFHVTCAQNYSQLLAGVFAKNRKILDKFGTSFLFEFVNAKEHFNFLCVLCARGKKPNFDHAINLHESLNKIPFRVFENDLLGCLIARAQLYQARVARELRTRQELAQCYDLLRKHLRLDKKENDTTKEGQMSAKRKRTIYNTIHNSITDKLGDECQAILANLLFDGAMLELSVEEFHILWVIWSILKEPTSITAVKICSKTNPTLPLQNNYFVYKRKLSIAEDDSKDTCENVEQNVQPPAASKKRKLESRDSESKVEKAKKLDKASVQESKKSSTNKTKKCSLRKNNGKVKVESSSSSGSEAEICLMGSKCLLPHDEEVDWVFCDGDCQGWFHMRCLNIPEGTQLDDQYFCDKCVLTRQGRKCALDSKCSEPTSERVNWIQCDSSCKRWFHQNCVGLMNPDEVSQIKQFYCVQCLDHSKQEDEIKQSHQRQNQETQSLIVKKTINEDIDITNLNLLASLVPETSAHSNLIIEQSAAEQCT